jgi:hypothetical protein
LVIFRGSSCGLGQLRHQVPCRNDGLVFNHDNAADAITPIGKATGLLKPLMVAWIQLVGIESLVTEEYAGSWANPIGRTGKRRL